MKHTKNIPRKSGFNHGSVQYLYIYLCVFTYISRTLVTPKRTNTYIETLCSSISSGCDYCCRPFLRKSLGNPSSVNGACWMCTSVDMARAQTAQRHGAKPSPPRQKWPPLQQDPSSILDPIYLFFGVKPQSANIVCSAWKLPKKPTQQIEYISLVDGIIVQYMPCHALLLILDHNRTMKTLQLRIEG